MGSSLGELNVMVRPRLRAELEILKGMDGLDLMFDPESGSYHRLSPASLAVVTVLDGNRTIEEIYAAIGSDTAPLSAALRGRVVEFIGTLAERGLLEGTEPPGDPTARRYSFSRLMPRFILVRRMSALLEPIAVVVRKWHPATLGMVLAALALVGFVVGLLEIRSHGATLNPTSLAGVRITLLATAVQLVAIAFHESSHALVAQVLKVPVRGLGVAMLFYVMPVAYVDRTDAYRLESRRSRIAIAVAGMVHDGIFTGAVGLVAGHATGDLAEVARMVLLFQLLMLAVNLNPLIPSDGYSAIEIAIGVVDARGRGAAFLRHALLRRELPAHLRAMTVRQKTMYGVFGAFCAIYVILLVGWMLLSTVEGLHAAMVGAGR